MKTSSNAQIVTTNFVPLDHQYAFYKRVVDPYSGEMVKNISSIEPRRAGKTIKFVNMMIDRALTKFTLRQDFDELRYAYASPTLKQSRRNVWDEFIRRLEHIPGFKKNESTSTIRIVERNTKTKRTRQIVFYIWGMERPLDLKGAFLDGLILDEDAQNPPWIYKEVLAPQIRDQYHKGWTVRTGTVRGRNHVYHNHKDFTEAMNEGDPNYFAYLTRTRILKHIEPQEIEEIKNLVGQDYWDQEYECMFGASGGDKYFASYVHDAEIEGRITSSYYIPTHPVFTFWDIGGVGTEKLKKTDLTAIWFMQKGYDGSNRFIDYRSYTDLDMQGVANEVRKLNYNYHTHFLPWDAGSNRFVQTPAQVLEEANIGDVEIVQRTLKKTRIDKARALLPTCYFDRNNCNLGLIALKEYSKKWDENNKIFVDVPAHDVHSHGADAFTYGALAIDDLNNILYYGKDEDSVDIGQTAF